MASEDHVLLAVAHQTSVPHSVAVEPVQAQDALTAKVANMLTNKNLNGILIVYKKEQ